MDSIWLHARQSLRESLTPDEFSQWIEPLNSVALQSGHLLLQVPSRFHYDWIQERYLPLIESTCREIDSTTRVHLQLPGGKHRRSMPAGPDYGHLPFITTFQAAKTFDNYVVAPFNRFGFAAAQAVGQEAGANFNPLLIQAPLGLGKTHLLHAIGNSCSAEKSGAAAYLNCRELVDRSPSLPSAFSDTVWQFIATTHVLLVDDIHLLPADGIYQYFLLDLFNSCYDVGRQMVFTANRLPHQIPELMAGFRSRLGWGLIARITEPDLNGCQDVIKQILKGAEAGFSEDICRFLIEQGPLNFHEIKECVDKLQEVVEKEGRFPNLKDRPLLLHTDTSPAPEKLTIQAVQKAVCKSYNVSMETLPKATKSRPLVIARQVGMYLSRKLIGSTYTSIGATFGGRDHSTVIYACRKVRGEMRRNPVFAERVVEIEKKLLEIYKEEN
jgi:chromosomal replication initiator protein